MLSSICFYSVSVYAMYLNWITVCCIAVAWHGTGVPSVPQGQRSIPAHSPPPWQLHKLQEGNTLTLKRWDTHCNSLFPCTKMWALPLLAPGAGKRGEIFCAVSSHRCSLQNLHWAFAKQEPSPGLCFSEAENRQLLWETDLKNISDTVLLKSSFSSLCMIFKMLCQMDVSSTGHFFLGIMNEVTLIYFIPYDGEQRKIPYLYFTVQ